MGGGGGAGGGDAKKTYSQKTWHILLFSYDKIFVFLPGMLKDLNFYHGKKV